MIVATKNSHKIKEISALVAGSDFKVMGLERFSDYVSPQETGQTFLENALIKAHALKEYFSQHLPSGKPHEIFILADDSGLECDDLGGAPGVLSARFAGPNATDSENNARLVESLTQATHLNRFARYVCSAVFVRPDGCEESVTETCEGRMVLVPCGQNGFGYDPYFYLEEYDKTMAELTLEEKNKISHRGKAVRKLLAQA